MKSLRHEEVYFLLCHWAITWKAGIPSQDTRKESFSHYARLQFLHARNNEVSWLKTLMVSNPVPPLLISMTLDKLLYPLNLNFLICNMGKKTAPTSQSYVRFRKGGKCKCLE